MKTFGQEFLIKPIEVYFPQSRKRKNSTDKVQSIIEAYEKFQNSDVAVNRVADKFSVPLSVVQDIILAKSRRT